MADKDKTQKQLISELTQLRQRMAELEASVHRHKKTEEEKAAVLDNISEHVVYQDTKMRVLWANRAACESVGVDLQKLVGSHCYEIWPRRRKPCVGCPVAKARKSGQPQEAEIATPDGRVWFIRGYPVRDMKGNITGAIEVTLDITERKQAEDTLRETSLFLRSILDSSSSISIVFTDLEQNILFWNKGAENIFGYKAKEMVNRRTVEILYPDEEDTRQTVEEIRSFILNKKRGLQREIKEITKAGRIRWISLTSTPRFDEQGNVIGILGIGEDITARKEAEKEATKASIYLDRGLSSAPDGVFLLDKEERFTYVNATFLNMTGHKEKEIVGKNIQEIIATIVPPDSVKIILERVRKRLATGESTVGEEIEILNKAGGKIPVSYSASGIKDDEGNVIGEVVFLRDITERKRTEEALRESEEKYRNLAERANDGIAIGQDGVIRYANARSTQMIGYTVEELIGAPFFDFFMPDELPKIREYYQRRMAGEDIPTIYETAMKHKDGRRLAVEVNAGIIQYQGKPADLIIVRDITERKRAEEALRESEEKYRALINGMNDTAWVIDLNGNFIDVNDAAVEVLGYSREEYLAMKPQDIDTNLDAEEISNLVKRMPKDKLQLFETIHTCKDGKKIPVEIKSTLMTYKGQQAILSIARDITERKQMEETLRESERRFRNVVETMKVGLSAVDKNGVLTYVNEYLAKMVGYSIDEMIGRPTIDFYYHEEGRKIQEEIFKKRRAGLRDTRSYEVIWRRRDGQKVYSILSPTPLFDEDGHYIGSFAIHTDITERKRTEEALRESADKYRAITSGVMEGFAEIDREGRFVDVNEESCRMSGYSRDEHLTMSVLDTEALETAEETKKRLQKIIKTGSDRFESRLRRKDGRIIDIEVSSTYFPQTGHVLIFSRDITERKRAEQELRRNYQQMQEMLVTTVKALASTVEMKDQYTAGHQPRVTELACAIAEEMGLPEERIEGIRMAGIVHDIGKIMVPAEILNKPGPLTEIQYEMVKMHPRAGFDILKGIKFPWPVAEIVLQHQELMDGSGYPQGLSGEEIILEARILTVANVVEAMVSHRPYRAAYDIREALAEITKNKAILYDPVVVDACLKLFAERRFTFD
jgi:PAS domain S-box-containing protein